MKLNNALSHLKEELSDLLSIMLVSERINSQRCLNENIDTSKTIIDHKETSEEFSQKDLNTIGVEIHKLAKDIKGMYNIMLVSERINSQRCLNQDLDTSKTIIDHKENLEEFTEEEVDKLIQETRRLVDIMLVSERINSQRCLNQDLDTSKTIIDHKEKLEDNKQNVKGKNKKQDLENTIYELKGILNEMLISERINTQICLNDNLDTSKTIIDHKE
ncbi:hypothetical protein [Terrisporobacter vanillatitrophus]|uniref:hypothetical protein n=1 Tax=Terrisporobacter vanillatitrophus TaxID=3058402 RepID=UPI003368CBFC